MNQFSHKLHDARPKLKDVAPLTYGISWGYAVVNFLLGLTFLLALDQDRISAPLLSVNDVLTYDVWGLIFIGLSITKAYALLTNNWGVLRKALFGGIIVKVFWLTSLVIRIFVSPGTLILAIIWGFFAYIQTVTYIYFAPKEERNDTVE